MTANVGDFEGPNRWWALVGSVPLVTGIVRWSAYWPFGISTGRTRCEA